MISEIKVHDLNTEQLIAEKVNEIRAAVGDGKRDFGRQIEVRCWDSVDARTATPTRLPFELLESMAAEILDNVPGVVSVTYNIATKPPSTIEAV